MRVGVRFSSGIRVRRPATAVLAAVLGVGVMTGVAVSPAQAEPQTLSPAPNANKSTGAASQAAEALAEAAETDARVEVTADRTATDTVYANPDGTMTREVASAPIRARDGEGKLALIDTSLEDAGDRLAPKVTTGEVSLSSDGEDAVAEYVVGDGQSVRLTYQAPLAEPDVENATATYPVEGSETEQVQVTAGTDGFTSNVVLSEAPTEAPTYSFRMSLDGLKASLDAGIVSLTDAKGTVVARSRPLLMWDAQRDEFGDPAEMHPVEAELVPLEGGDAELRLKPSMEFLSDDATQYPVTVDPTIESVTRMGDTYYFEGQALSDTRGGDYRLIVGESTNDTYRSRVTFTYGSLVGTTVTQASLKLRQYSSQTCTPKQTDAFPVIEDTLTPIVWSTAPAVSTDARWKSSKSFNHGQGACPDAFESIDVTPIVNAWATEAVDGDTAGRNLQAIELRAASENDPSFQKRFCSLNLSNNPSFGYCNSAANVPVLSVTYTPELGRQSWYSMTGHPLNDRSSLMVNNKNGNAVVMASDVNVAGLGMDMTIDRFYNSQLPSEPATTLGQGWTLSVGPDVRLEKKSQWRYDYHAPSGTVFGSFMRGSSVVSTDPDAGYNRFERPTGGVNAELSQDGDTFRLEFHGNDMTYEFTELGPDGHAYLTKMIDRSDNEISLAYGGLTSEGIPKLSTIVDTGGRTYDATYSGDHITQISHSTAGVSRTWAYGQSGGTLGSYTDPAGKAVSYDYTTLPSGNQVLTTIADPTTAAGAPTTYLEYGHDDETGVDQVTDVRYRYGGGNDDTYDFAFTYYTNRAPVCADEDNEVGDFSTVVTDPAAGETTYCYEGRSDSGDDAQTWTFDAEGNERSTTFTADNGTLQATTPGNSATNNATVAEYGQIADQLTQVTAPKNEGDGDQAGTASFDYDHSGGDSASPAGGDYLPSSVTDANSSCTRYEYDDNGRTTAAYTGLTPADPRAGGNRDCSSEGGDTSFHREYNDDGTTKESWDGNAENESGQDDPAQSDKTLYTYWAPSDSGYVAGSKGQVKTIRKPGGSCESSSRELCTSYAYDGAGRVATMTDGRGKVTRYAYDAIDRTTRVLHDGATTCAHSAGTCITYAYDAEGNMVSRTEKAGVTMFEYDRLNRQIGQDTPDGVMMDMQYDGAGNLTRYEQSIPGGSGWDEVVYDYDAANRLVSVTDASGTITVSPDSDGRVEKIEFPGAGGVSVDYSYQHSGKPETLVVTNAADDELRRHGYDYTKEIDLADYGLSGTLHTESDQMQTRTTDHVASDVDGTVTYRYDDSGRLTLAGDSNDDQRDYEYSYDEVNNITEADVDGEVTYYGYDLAGQLCWSGGTDGTHLGTTCPATPSGNTTYQHDAAGNNLNTTTDPTVYDAASRVSRIGGINAEYYDLGNDIRHRHGDTQAANGTLGITALKTGTDIRLFTRDPSGTVLNQRDGNGTTNFVTEPTGHVVALLDPAGHEVGAYTYGPYGDTHTYAQNGGARAETNPFRYIGAYQDIEGDNYYKLGARYYNGAGHFTQPDAIAGTIGNPKTMTAYNYAAADPINHSDPSGNAFTDVIDSILEPASVTAGFIMSCAEGGALGTAAGGLGGLVFGAGVAVPLTAAVGGTIGCSAGVFAYGAGIPFPGLPPRGR